MRSMRRLLLSAILVTSAASALSAAMDQPPRSPDGSGGGEYALPEADELTDLEREKIWAAIRENRRALESSGRLPAVTGAHPLFIWPLRLAAGLTDPGYHTILNFVDQDSNFPNYLRDFACGVRTYDRSDGYNHQGIDFVSWPFAWQKMDHGEVEIVAAAPGIILYKTDGNFDRSCGFNNNPWNAVYVQHADGSMAWYGHMKAGSTTVKPVGASVAQGEYLGVVGSSGNSSGPHLHLEVYDSASQLNEPFQGPCNVMNSDSWWQAQRPLKDSAVNHIATGFNSPSFPACPAPEITNEAATFLSGTRIFFLAYYRDELSTLPSQYRILRPDGSLYASWSHTSPANHYISSYWYFYFTNFAPSGPAGLWRFEVTFNGQTHAHSFTLDVPPASAAVPDRDGSSLGLRADRSGESDVTLAWSPTCLASDTDFEVYEGEIGAYYSHEQFLCTTGGATTVTFTPNSDSAYYLVVPTNGLREGSYGTGSSGVERPTGSTPCHVRLVAGCP